MLHSSHFMTGSAATGSNFLVLTRCRSVLTWFERHSPTFPEC